jgi:hypothetical protein
MDTKTQKHLNNLRSEEREMQNQAFFYFLEATEKPVEWAYEVWDELVKDLSHQDNHRRAIAAQILCRLATSDPENRMDRDFPALMAVTQDERFVTARHCLQSIWRVGTVNEKMQKIVVDALADRFRQCVTEKNCTLIRYDIMQGLRNLYDEVKDEAIREQALQLMEIEEDLKYRKKYANVWRNT